MRKSCSYCGRTHDASFTCPAKPQRPTSQTMVRKTRNKNNWKKTKKGANERDHYLCRVCLAAGVLAYEDLETHHIVPIEEDASRAYDKDNAITLCRRHHEQAERGEIERATLFRLAAGEAELPEYPPGGHDALFVKADAADSATPYAGNLKNEILKRR